MRTIGIDLGGTNATAIVWDDSEITGRAKVDTPQTGGRDGVIDALVEVADGALSAAGRKRSKVAAVGIGTPGAVLGGRTVQNAANVPGFEERFDLAGVLGERLGLPVRAANDVTAAAVGEHRHGAGRGADDLFVVFLGTGVGSGLVLGGTPFEGAHGAAGEFGHTVVDGLDGPPAPDGRRGTVEGALGRRALTAAVEREIAAGRHSVLFDLMRAKGKDRPTSSVWAAAVEAADPVVVDLLERGFRALAAGIASTVNLLDVERVVIGGGLGDKLGDWMLLRVNAALAPALFLQPPRVQVVQAALGDDGGAIGAATLAAEVA